MIHMADVNDFCLDATLGDVGHFTWLHVVKDTHTLPTHCSEKSILQCMTSYKLELLSADVGEMTLKSLGVEMTAEFGYAPFLHHLR